jgi:aldehyde dehydrogenase (NAD+)
VDLTKFYINGEFVDPSSKETLEIINPATEEEIGIVALGSTIDVDKAVYSARKAFSVSSKLSKKDRLDILETIRENYKKRYRDVSEAIRLEMGAPVKLAEGAQTATGLGHLKTAMRVLEKHEFEYKHEDYIVREEPIGVCGLITPWNWPINQIVSKFAPAFAAGCTVVLKPSEIAPLSAMIIAEIIHESQIPPGMFNLVNGLGNVVGEAMSSHKDIDMMSFTGSTRGGVAVAKASATNVKRVSQELGGKSPNLILDDNSFNTSITNGVIHVMGNSGQSCNAPTRMLVPKSRHDEAITIAKSALEKVKVGDPLDLNSDLGPLVSKNQFDKVQKLIKKGIEEGANLVAGGTGRPNGYEKGFYARPTIFGNVSNQMVIAKEEIFGPVLAIIPYDDLEEAISIANDTIYGLAAYVTGEDQEKCLEISRELRAGQISINYGSSGPSAPFGGYKQSGNGREKAEWGLTEFLEVKAIMSG